MDADTKRYWAAPRLIAINQFSRGCGVNHGHYGKVINKFVTKSKKQSTKVSMAPGAWSIGASLGSLVLAQQTTLTGQWHTKLSSSFPRVRGEK
jgi:hypothetical protein